MFSITPIATTKLLGFSVSDVWKAMAVSVNAWLRNVGVDARLAVILVPQVWHLPLARQAWSNHVGGWLPRIETPQTLAAGWLPASMPMAGSVSFDVAADRLTALGLLRQAGLTQGMSPLALDHALSSVVQTAQGMARAASWVAPQSREAHWQRGREVLGAACGPGGREQALALVALEWAAQHEPARTDVLFAAEQGEALGVAAWVGVQAGGVDLLARAVLQTASEHRPCAWVNLDAPIPMTAAQAEAPLPAHPEVFQVAVCDDFEEEAQRSAAQVLHHLSNHESPVVLVAQDRVLVRRVQALLARQHVAIQDETGCPLSTTTAAALVMAWLRLLGPQASLDEVLDALKRIPGREDAVGALEAVMRRLDWRRWEHVVLARLPAPAAWVWQAVLRQREQFDALQARPLGAWVAALTEVLKAFGLIPVLASEAAGMQVLGALQVSVPDAQFDPQVDDLGPLDWPLFVSWVDQVLTHASLACAPAPGAQVVVTPLSHAVLRPFAAVVFPGADATHWGASESLHPLLTPSQAEAFGLPNSDRALVIQWACIGQLTRVPRLTILRRLNDVDEHLLPSPFLERLLLLWDTAKPASARPIDAVEVRVLKGLVPEPVHAMGPAAPSLVPARLSASACEALRSCPYRFFALRMLRLQSVDELALGPGKRDYGDWLHKVLWRFHSERVGPRPRDEECEHLRRVALESQALQGWDDAEFLPYLASLERLITPYLDWLAEREAQGVFWLEGEREITASPEAWGGVLMHGVIDRLDRLGRVANQPPTLELIDYKTGSAQALRQSLKRPMEETQLAFYAALLHAQAPDEVLRAAYLPLDEGRRLQEVTHPDLAFSAERLVEGIGHDLARLREGAPLWPLGQGTACTYCQARGLCRRDHWVMPVAVPASLEVPQ